MLSIIQLDPYGGHLSCFHSFAIMNYSSRMVLCLRLFALYLWNRFLEERLLISRVNTHVILLNSIKSNPLYRVCTISHYLQQCMAMLISSETIQGTLQGGERHEINLCKPLH